MREQTIHLAPGEKLGLISDVHNRTDLVEKILSRHPDIKRWACLGDIVDMFDHAPSDATAQWWADHDIPTLLGNHDSTVASNFWAGHVACCWLRSLPHAFRIWLPTGMEMLAYHSLPQDNVTFVEPAITEREFLDDFFTADENTLSVLVGHNHLQFHKEFQHTRADLWSIGAVKEGRYAVWTGEKMKLCSL